MMTALEARRMTEFRKVEDFQKSIESINEAIETAVNNGLYSTTIRPIKPNSWREVEMDCFIYLCEKELVSKGYMTEIKEYCDSLYDISIKW